MMKSTYIKTTFFFLFTFLIIQSTDIATGTPLFSAISAKKCDTCHEMPDRSKPKWIESNYKIAERECRLSCSVCHTNPSGGMLRNRTGIRFGTLTLPAHKRVPGDIADPDKDNTDNIGYGKDSVLAFLRSKHINTGGDFRFMFLANDKQKNNLAFFPMQADLYIDVQLHKNISFFYQTGITRGGLPASRETSALLHNLPYNSYLKMGKFIPPYGLRLADHTAFIRTKLTFDHSLPETYVTGYEIGAEPVGIYGRFAQFNADLTPLANRSGSTPSGVSAVAGWRGLWLQLGGSFLRMDSLKNGVSRSAAGVSGAISPYNIKFLENIVYLFEFDARDDSGTIDLAIAPEGDAVVSFNELDYLLQDGVNLKLRYETFVPDSAVQNNEQRFMAGVDLYPFPFTELNLQYRVTDIDNSEKKNEVLLILHLWF